MTGCSLSHTSGGILLATSYECRGAEAAKSTSLVPFATRCLVRQVAPTHLAGDGVVPHQMKVLVALWPGSAPRIASISENNLMLFRVAPPRYLPADKHIQWQGCLHLRPILPRQMPACKNITCGRRGCTAGSSHIMATCVKKQRTAERLANCFGRSLIFFPHHRLMMLPRVWVNSSGTAVSSRFNSRGTFPAALAFWHNHWHHFQVA